MLHGYANRTSYAIAPDGTVLAAYSAMDPDGHVSHMLDAVKQWANTGTHPGPG